MAIQTLQQELVEQEKEFKKKKKNLQKKTAKEKIQHKLEIKRLRQKVEEFENELKAVNVTKQALIQDGQFANEYLAAQQRNNVREKAYLRHLVWLIKLKQARIEKLENSISAAGPQAIVESTEDVTDKHQRTEKPIIRVVRQRPYAIYVIISVFHYANHLVHLISGFINFEKFNFFSTYKKSFKYISSTLISI